MNNIIFAILYQLIQTIPFYFLYNKILTQLIPGLVARNFLQSVILYLLISLPVEFTNAMMNRDDLNSSLYKILALIFFTIFWFLIFGIYQFIK